MIRVHQCYRRFGSVQALGGVSFEAHPGEILALLGPNGAGKTTIIHIIAGIDYADQGDVEVDGIAVSQQPREVRKRVGLVPQDPGFYSALTAWENLNFWGAMYGVPSRELNLRCRELLELTGLNDRADEPVSQYSGGMRRRLNLALGLIHRPSVILLDEPTLEVDPQSRRRIVDFVRGLAREGATVLYTTHQLGDAQEVCDRIVILDRGKVIANGTLEELRMHLPASNRLRIEFSYEVSAEMKHRLERLPGAAVVTLAGGVAQVEIQEIAPFLVGFAEIVTTPGVIGFRFEEASLETIFLHLTGRGLRD